MSPWRFLLFAAMLLLAGCKQNVLLEAERPDILPFTTQVEKVPSTITIPIDIPLQAIQDKLNAELQGTFYEDNSFDGDNLKLKISKTRPISVSGSNGKLGFNIPLTVFAEGKLAWKPCDFCPEIGKTASGGFDINLITASTIAFSPSWQVQPVTEATYEWGGTKPKLSLGVADIPLDGVIDIALKPQLSKLSRMLDKALAEQIQLKALIQPFWDQLQVPMQVSEEYNTWLKTYPKAVSISAITVDGRSLKTSIGITAFLDLVAGARPTQVIVKNIPGLQQVESLPEMFTLNLTTTMPYAEVSRYANLYSKGVPYTFDDGKYTVYVDSLNLFGSGDKMIVKAAIHGKAKGSSLKGIVYLKGVPFYDSQSRSIKMRDIDFDVKSKNVLVGAAGWLASTAFKKKVAESINYNLDEDILYTRKLIEESLAEPTDLGGFGTLKAVLNEFQPTNILVTEKGLVLQTTVTGKLAVKLTKF